jgi:radical SAM superfamily enzyme YgiQ (UPF0313 family)
MKVLLINPPIDHIIETEMPLLIRRNEGVFPPLGLLYIAAYLNKETGYAVEVLDLIAESKSREEIEQSIRNYRPDIVGITSHTHNLIDVILVAEIVKKIDKRIYVCLGGPHVSVFPRESLGMNFVDFAIPGEGEETFAELVKSLEEKKDLKEVKGIFFKREGKIVNTAKRESVKDLNVLPFPDRRQLSYKKYHSVLGSGGAMATIVTSRGCPYECVFCSTPRGSYRVRSPENVVDEMQECLDLGIKEVHFIDDTFNADPERVIKICAEIKRRQLKIKWSFRGRVDKITKSLLMNSRQAGCYRIHLGVETSSNEGLSGLNKGFTIEQIQQAFKLTKAAGIYAVVYFLIGCPHERTKEDVLKTINFSKAIKPDFALFNILTPYPATKLYEEGLAKGILKKDYWKEFALNPNQGFKPPLWEEWLSRDELRYLLNLAYRRFYIRPGFIFKEICSLRSWGALFRRLKTSWDIFRLPLKK